MLPPGIAEQGVPGPLLPLALPFPIPFQTLRRMEEHNITRGDRCGPYQRKSSTSSIQNQLTTKSRLEAPHKCQIQWTSAATSCSHQLQHKPMNSIAKDSSDGVGKPTVMTQMAGGLHIRTSTRSSLPYGLLSYPVARGFARRRILALLAPGTLPSHFRRVIR